MNKNRMKLRNKTYFLTVVIPLRTFIVELELQML